MIVKAGWIFRQSRRIFKSTRNWGSVLFIYVYLINTICFILFQTFDINTRVRVEFIQKIIYMSKFHVAWIKEWNFQ